MGTVDFSRLLILFAALLGQAFAHRIMVFNDVHLNLTYDLPSKYGTYGYDSPLALLDLMTDDAASQQSKSDDDLDAKFMLGDQVRHGLAPDIECPEDCVDPPNNFPNITDTWAEQQTTMRTMI